MKQYFLNARQLLPCAQKKKAHKEVAEEYCWMITQANRAVMLPSITFQCVEVWIYKGFAYI